MGLIAREIEKAGIPTLSMTSALSITRAVGAPRAAFVDFPLGHTTGKAHDPTLQFDLMRSALAAFEELTEPGAVKHLPFRWAADDGWRAQAFGRPDGDGDARVPRVATPQYQSAADREAAAARHVLGPCGACIGAD